MSTPDFFLHEKALCESSQIGAGTRIWAFSHILPGARVGKNCNICEHVFIENKVVIGDSCTIKTGVSVWDNVTLEDGVFVGPDAVFTNDLRPRAFLKRGDRGFLSTTVKRGATLGANVTIICGVTVGEYAMVGAGSVVAKDVPPHTLVVGNPARALLRICFCGEPLQENDFCPQCRVRLCENSEQETIRRFSR